MADRLAQVEEQLRLRQDEVNLSPAGADIRLDEINAELLRRGGSIEFSQPETTPEEQLEIDKSIVLLSTQPEMAEFGFDDLLGCNK